MSPLSPATLLPAFWRGYARRYVWIYALGLLMLLATNGLTIAIPRMIKEVFDALAAGGQLDRVHILAALISVAAVVVIVVRTLSRVLFFNPGRTIEFRVRNDMLTRLLAMSGNWFRGRSTGDLVSRAANDASFVRALVGFSTLMLLNLIMAASFTLWQMLATNVRLTVYCVLPLAASLWLMRFGMSRLFTAMRQTQEELGRLSEHILEALGGVAVIQGAVAEPAFQRRFDLHNDRYTQINLEVTALRCFLLPLAAMVGNFCIFLLLYVGGEMAVQGEMSVGDLAAYASYVTLLAGSLTGAGWLISGLQRGYVGLQRCWEVVQLQGDRANGVRQLPQSDRGLRVQVKGLNYRYPDAEPDGADVLSDISFAVAPGQTLGIYGPVGSGKTTLTDLLTGLLPPPPGAIELDGVDVCELDPASLWSAVAVAPQQAFLFSRSLRENVAFIDRADAIDERRVWQAVDKALLGDEVRRMTDGLETVVGERGLNLSGGQRQRAQLARAMYRNYRLLLLDDVLSAVDHDTEERLLATISAEIDRDQSQHTAVIVSSRLSALVGADEILVLDEGRIVERGSHNELIGAGGMYANVWEVQRTRREAA